ncbi:hypothetical protein HID58_022659 [Brassica napus]|uniref:Uncharacterized protein n=1 Tax=Brassica napus TaxID=3708 RepID=A0ABQ8D2G7_BRANA|nr:hypothetical protein HID58_022659 [Brassica napus]
MEDFLEIEEFLELEDGETLEYFDSDREVTMEDFLELEEWLDSEQKLDDERNNMRKDLETLPPIHIEEAAGIRKRVKRIHDPVKIVVSCAVFEVKFPMPPDIGTHLGFYIGV